jgi:hypothetical protein
LTLAGVDGRVTLVLRNATDQKTDPVPMHDSAELYSGPHSPRPPVTIARNIPKPPPHVMTPPPPPPPPAPVVVPDEIVMIRGREKTVEVIGTKKQ